MTREVLKNDPVNESTIKLLKVYTEIDRKIGNYNGRFGSIPVQLNGSENYYLRFVISNEDDNLL